MNKKYCYCAVLAAALCAANGVQGAAAAGNCQAGSVPQATASTVRNLTMVRSWDEKYGYYDSSSGSLKWVQTGRWTDGGDDATPAAQQKGCYWLNVTLTYGKNYVIGFPVQDDYFVYCTKKTSGAISELKQVVSNGMTYYYIQQKDWATLDSTLGTISFDFLYMGPAGSVGKTFAFDFREATIDSVFADVPGTLDCPIVLDVTTSGSVTIEDSVRGYWGEGTPPVTVYSVSIKGGERYAFTSTHPSMNLVIFPEVSWDFPLGILCPDLDESTSSNLVVTAAEDMTLKFALMQADGYGNPGGGTLAWKVGEDKPDEPVVPAVPVWAGTFRGTLTDADEGTVTAQFNVVAKIMDDGTTNVTGLVTLEGADYAFVSTNESEMVNVRRIGTKIYRSYFDVTLPGDGTLVLEGSFYRTADDERFFEGILGGGIVAWEDSFLKCDPDSESAADMGITSGAFKDEPAGSPTLKKIQSWGALNNVPVSQLNDAAFDAEGDPASLVASAYLLDCEPNQKVVEEETKKFVITSFDPSSGVIVRGDRKGGDAYGNGQIEIRSSTSPAGTFDTTEKGASAQLFYRAYLVR